MKTEKLFLDELNPYSKGYKVKVRVIEKNRSKESPQKKVTYQSLLLQDDKGNKMKAALFGEQVEGYKDIIAYNGEYEIANAIIRPIDQRWKGDSEALDYQMTFSKNSVIQPVDGTEEQTTPQYRKIAAIPKFADASERFDVLSVVLFVEDPPGKQVTFGNRSSMVREFMIIDESVKHPLVVSAWHDLAENECDLLHMGTSYLPIVGLTAMRPSTHKGFSLTTTLSTTVIHDPEGEQAKQLQSWVSKNRTELTKMRLKILATKNSTDTAPITTIADLQLRKAVDVLQDEKHTLEITIPDPDFDKLRAYVGCSVCGKSTDAPLGKTFTCEICHRSQCLAAPKVAFKCEVTDGTGFIPFTMFTESCEALFKLTAADIFHIRHSDNLKAFEALSEQLRANPVTIQVGPSTSLSKNHVLQWVLHEVNVNKPPILEKPGQEDDEEPKGRPAKRCLVLPAHSSSDEEDDEEPKPESPVNSTSFAGLGTATIESRQSSPANESPVTPLDV